MPETPSPTPAPGVPPTQVPREKRRWYNVIPAPVWGLIALAAGMGLGTLYPTELAFVGKGVKDAFSYLAAAAPYIIYFTLVAAIGDMLKTGSAAKFAFWVTITYTITTILAGIWAIVVLWPLFQLDFVSGIPGGNGSLGAILDNVVTLATTSPPFIAISWAAICGVGLHFGSKFRATEWFARPTFEVLRKVGVDGVVLAGQGLRYVLPVILFAIGVFIPTGVADAIGRSESGIAAAGASSAFSDLSSIQFYLISVGVTVFILMSFFGLAAFFVCRYAGFSLKRFFKDYFLYVYPFAWATASSAATIPLNLERTQNGLKVRKEIRDFIIPLGATVNLDGTMISAFVLTVLAGTIVGYTPSVTDLLVLIIPLTVVTIGVPGIPGGVALIAPPVIASFLPIPDGAVAAFIAIFFGFSIGLSDQFRTGVNSCDNGLICLLYEKLYPKYFARKDAADTGLAVDELDEAGAV